LFVSFFCNLLTHDNFLFKKLTRLALIWSLTNLGNAITAVENQPITAENSGL